MSAHCARPCLFVNRKQKTTWSVSNHQVWNRPGGLRVTTTCIWTTHFNLMVTVAFAFGFPSTDPGSHWAGSRSAAKNWAESLGAIAPPGRPCRGPEPSPVPHHQADATLSSSQYWAERPSPCPEPQHSCASERPQADCPDGHWPPTHSLALQSLGATAFSANICVCRNNLNTLFSLTVNPHVR